MYESTSVPSKVLPRFVVERDLRVVAVLCALARLFAELALGEELVHGAENADERARVRERLSDADGDEILVDEAGAGFEGDGDWARAFAGVEVMIEITRRPP